MTIELEEPIGVAHRSEVLRFAVPLSPGAWTGAAAAPTRMSSAGRVTGLLDYRVEQRWPDGSVRLAFLAVAVDLPAQGRAELLVDTEAHGTLEAPSANFAHVPCLAAADLDGDLASVAAALGVTVDSVAGGCERLSLPCHAERPGRECLGAVRTADGVEVSGQLSCVGQGAVEASLTLTNRSTAPVTLRQVTYHVDWPLLLGASAGVVLVIGEACSEWTTTRRCAYLQLSAQGAISLAGETVHQVNVLGRECRLNRVWVAVRTADRCLTFAVRNLLETFPVKLEVDGEALRCSPFPAEAGQVVLAAGMSRTCEIGMAAGPAQATPHHQALAFQYPLAPRVLPESLNTLGCFPRAARYRPRQYPRLESWIKWMIGNRPRAYGWRHFGDEPNHGYTARGDGRVLWTNNEYDYPLIALTQYLRCGDRIAWEDDRAAVRHMMDIDSIAAAADPDQVGGQHSHSPDHVTHPAAPDHEWLEGLLLHYLMTDDGRALQRAEALAERLLRLTEAGEFDDVGKSPRRYGWTLIALCAMYGFSQQERYLQAAGRLVDTMLDSERAHGGLRWAYWDTPSMSLDGFMVGIAGAGLGRYHRFTGDERVAQAILRTCDALLELASPEGLLNYKGLPLVRLPGDISSCIVLEVLAYGYELCGNREYLRCGARQAEQALRLTESGLMITWNAEQRVAVEGGVYLRETVPTPKARMIDIMRRGIWPFMDVAHEAGIFAGHRNPYAYACDR